jgi:uncharacterized protein (TIGR03086 family)
MTTTSKNPDPVEPTDSSVIEQLARVFRVVDDLVTDVRPDQWSAPTPCSDWTVRQLVAHLSGMNKVFAALLSNEPVPLRGERPADSDLAEDFRLSSATLLASFARPGVLEHTYRGPLGTTTGSDRANIRLYDLLAHGWDLAQATGQPAVLPEDIAEQSLIFVRNQVSDESRPGRFAPAQPVPHDAAALEKLVAFLGRSR